MRSIDMVRCCSLLNGLAALTLAACGDNRPVNPPTEPAPPVTGPETAAPFQPESGSAIPGVGPANFVGRWAADVSWCPNTTGPERPIEISLTRFEGYENSCAITSIDQVADGYMATLVCVAEGTASEERAKFAVSDDVLRLTYPDRGGAPVLLRKCTTLAETP